MGLLLLLSVYLSLSCNHGCSGSGDLFEEYIYKFNKTYHPSTAEYIKRKSIFEDTLERINWLNRHRKHNSSALYGLTEFSDLTPQEFHDLVIRRWLPRNKPQTRKLVRNRRNVDFSKIEGIPKKLDWRERGVIAPVRNQDKCGACWAFSTVETIESMRAIQTKVLEELSVQQMIDCSDDNHGCDGGDTCTVLEWLSIAKVKLATEHEYPFRDETDGQCELSPKTGVMINSNYTCDNYTGDEGALVKVIAQHGPVAAAVDASGWQDYLGGIIQYHCETKRNHAVQIVGYDLTGDVPYYIVRNSWGTKFGINGYLHIAIGNNLCAISEEISSLSVQL